MAGAIVPFRSSGAAADQTAPHRLVQVGPICLHLHQDPSGSASLPAPGGGGSTRAGGGGGALIDWLIDEEHAPEGVQWPTESGGTSGTGQAHLANVGLVVWQSGLVLAELLMRRPPFGPWGKHVHVLDLGTGTGLVGLALALAGARVTLTDLPHILPLTRANVAANLPADSGDLVVAELPWGQDPAPLIQQVGGPPDVITAADVLYDVSQHAPLLATISALSAPHTETYISYRCRSVREEGFSAAAQAAGFAMDLAPDSLLAEEYQGGAYRVLRLVRRDAPLPAETEAVGGPGVVVVAEEAGQDAQEDDGREELEHRPCRQS